MGGEVWIFKGVHTSHCNRWVAQGSADLATVGWGLRRDYVNWDFNLSNFKLEPPRAEAAHIHRCAEFSTPFQDGQSTDQKT